MFYIVGLGNPGEKYDHTRHNVGFMVVDSYCTERGLPSFISSRSHSGAISEGVLHGHEVTLLLPDTYMNNSGVAVQKLVTKEEAKQLIVIYDDVDLPIGEFRISAGRGDGGHNGIKSIVSSLGTKDFIRLRVGVASRSFWTGKAQRPAAAALSRHVLGHFSKREEKVLVDALPRMHAAIDAILENGAEAAMNSYNT